MRPARGATSLALLLLLLVPLLPVSSEAQELLSWWKRDLLPLDLEPGSWVVYASEEFSEGQLFSDTLAVEILAADSLARRWVELRDAGSPESDLLLIDPERLRPSRPLLDALVRHVRRLPGGELVEEDVEEHRRSRLVQRHFQDPFEDPSVERVALADTLLQGRSAARERVVLHEVRRRPQPVGGGVHVRRLRSQAELCPAVPVFGVLRGSTVTEVETRPATGAGEDRASRRMPPLRSEMRWTCLDFGRGEPAGLPADLDP